MSTEKSTSDTGDLRQAAAEVLSAWRVELAALFGDAFGPDRSELLVAYADDGIEAGASDGRRDAVPVLPAAAVLRPVVRLPFASHSVLRSALTYELERLSPVPPDQIYFDFRVLSRDRAAKSAEIELRIIRRDIVDDAARRCRVAGLAVGAIRFGDDALPADPRHFPVDRHALLLGLWRRWSVALLGGATILLLLAVLLAAYLRGSSRLDALSDALQDEGTHAARAEQLQQRIERASAQLAFLAKQKHAPLFAAILADIAHVLPDDSWIAEFDMSGGRIRIGGYSRSASDLIAVFDRSGRFTNAQFAAPVTQGATPGIERFDLTFEIVGQIAGAAK